MNASAFPLSPPPHAQATPEGEELFTIGELAREFSTTLRALRFYEDKGLLSPRREGMTRLYTAADRERLGVILKGKHLGFTLSEIRALVAAHASSTAAPSAECAEAGLALTRDRCLKQLAQLERQRAEIDSAICELKSLAESMPA
ncbi:MerR family transcriptional regulator [Xanthobacter sp. TB0136]|uniref:MerR family transcriptional regulator n=1 Tax=Xanthobacter sp. TB0136 TaxID=3459177 RepID=UPI0040394A62